MSVEIYGVCEPAFTKVRETFVRNFAEYDEVGASVAVTVEGRMVVDLWAGHADEARTRPWDRDTIVNVYSTTKGMTALCAHMLIDRGDLDVDAPVAQYWPEFAQAGKAQIPVRWLLTHRAGLMSIREPLPTEALFDWELICSTLAAEEPWWEPGTQSGYHAMTFGFLVGEVIRRITGMSVGTFFAREVATPLGLTGFFIGVPPAQHHRIADLLIPAGGARIGVTKSAPPPLQMLDNPPVKRHTPNSYEWRCAELPAGNGHGNARALAEVYGALANGGAYGGVRIISSRAIERMREPAPTGNDLVLSSMPGSGPMAWNLGFMPNLRGVIYGPNPRAFGHTGHGGSMGMCDPEARVSIAYAMNRMKVASSSNPPDLRALNLVHTTYACL